MYVERILGKEKNSSTHLTDEAEPLMRVYSCKESISNLAEKSKLNAVIFFAVRGIAAVQKYNDWHK